ncbi:PP2C family protein-serine/threonine phosphatase [Propionivibrio sp.]|uniref:PP2C family protein-serine/threonine phosphatase n=1 Tax=Propionivibrio sp. TaxID=2212460 RepID=UPI0039E5E0ED
MKFTIYQESRPGKRPNNEDRLAHCYSRDALLMVVADGMGGHYYGEVAAQIAVQCVTEAFQREANPNIHDPFSFINRTMLNAHCAILDFADTHKLQDSPRTTCVACLIQDSIAYWAHAGDSRLYVIRGGRVLTRTRDHSRVQLLIDQGMISPAQAPFHPDRNKVYSCLGGRQDPDIELSRKTPLEAGDVVALCTDGLWGLYPDDLLAAALKNENLMKSVPELMEQADGRGGQNADNLSIVAVRWEDNYVEPGSGNSSTIHTQTMPLGAITTRLDEFGRNPKYRTELTDDEIERAIQEIRSTIQKYSK